MQEVGGRSSTSNSANRAIYSEGWVACTTPSNPPWIPAGASVDEITGYNWELYHTDNDFSQAENLAVQMPERLNDLQLLFYAEAAKYNVLPIDNSKTARRSRHSPEPHARSRVIRLHRRHDPHPRRSQPGYQE